MRRRILNTKNIIQYVDICLVNNNTLDKLIVDGEEYNLDIYPKEQYTPIGVVVVPSSHTDDGTARVISLVSMSNETPDSGNITGYGCYWGGYGSDISTLKNLQYSPRINTDLSNPFENTQRIIDWGSGVCYLSSDYLFNTEYEGVTNPYDIATCYASSSQYACPSPYLNDGSRNEIYHNTANTGNILADMDGKRNTEKILSLDNSYSTDWQTGRIKNIEDNEFIHPTAQCCWRYHTFGTNQGDWYLPSAGELGYLIARFKPINNSIGKIENMNIVACKKYISLGGTYVPSSTESSPNSAIYLHLYRYNCYLIEQDKDVQFSAFAFIAV